MQALSIYRRFSHHLMPRGRIQLLWPAMRRSPAADHLAATPVARLRLRTAHEASQVCSTAPASDHVIIAMGRRPETSRFGRASGAREERRSCAFWHLGKPFRTRNMQAEIVPSFFCERQNARIWEESCNVRLAGSLCLWNVVACPPRGDWMEVRGRSAGGDECTVRADGRRATTAR